MKPISGKRLCKVLESRGWVYDRTSGSHRIYVWPQGGRPSLSVPVHGNKDLKAGTQRQLMRDTGLTEADL